MTTEVIVVAQPQVQVVGVDNTQIIRQTAQVVQIVSIAEQGPEGPAGSGVPTGGTIGQVLTKNSSTDYDDSWASVLKAFNFYWGTPQNTTLTLVAYALVPFTINELFALQTVSGSIILTLTHNGTDIIGVTSITANSTPQNVTATGNNVVAVGDQVALTLASNSSASGLQFSMQATQN